jgi:SAM-dependent methyltransferase
MMRRRWWRTDTGVLPRETVMEGIWRLHFERRARWAGNDAERSGWSADGLAARLAAFENLLPELVPASGAAVLDLGCGAATYTALLASKGYRVTALDYSFPTVQRAAHGSRARARFAVADGHRAPLRTASFDLVLCIGVLQFSGNPALLIGEAARLVKPGGALLIETLNRVHFVVPAIKLLELTGLRSPSPVWRHSVVTVEESLHAAGIERTGRLDIYVLPTGDGYPADAVRAATRSLRRLPPLRRFAVSAIWWYGRKR